MAHLQYMLNAPKPNPSIVTNSTDSILNPQPWYNDFVTEDPPEDQVPRKSRNIHSSEILQDETWEVNCEEDPADETSLELIQKINDKFNGNDQKTANETDTNGMQKQSARENQMSSVAGTVLSPPKVTLSEELREFLLKATLEKLDKINLANSKENSELMSKNTKELPKQTTPVHAEPIYRSDEDGKGKRGKGYSPISKLRKNPKYKPPAVNILENNIRIRRSKDGRGFRIKLVSPHTTFGSGVVMTSVNNLVTIGTRSSVSIETEPVLTVGQLCKEYVLTETVLRDATLSKKGYLILNKRTKRSDRI